MDLGIIGNLFGMSTEGNNGNASLSESINIPGTLMGQLQNVVATKNFMQTQARYNNYLTDSYGAAQMASDRYMSLKERIPMSIEYYLTPTQRKEVVLYINPNKINISTQKVKAKVFTRGGIYFHHYGDDVWTMDITGETGMSQMRGIEALEEVYHHSGTLLKYQNVDVTTVHTNKMTSLTGSSSSGGGGILDGIAELTGIAGMAQKAKDWIGNKVIGTLQDGLGQAGSVIGGALSSGTGGGCFGTGKVDTTGGILFGDLAGAAANGGAGAVIGTAISGIGQGIAQNGFNPGGSFKENLNGLTGALTSIMGGYDGDGIKDMAAEMLLGSMGLGGSGGNVLEQLGADLEGGVDAIANFLGGGKSSSANMPNQATQGNYYSLGRMTTQELNRVVNSVQTQNKNRKIDRSQAAQNWSYIEDNLTDMYRPRQIFIYFDDRVFLGHFDQFTWTRVANTMSITYTMKFTITQQGKVPRGNIKSGNTQRADLKNVLTGMGLQMLGGAIGGMFGGSSNKTNQKSSTTGGANNPLNVNTDWLGQNKPVDPYNGAENNWQVGAGLNGLGIGNVNSSSRNPYRSSDPFNLKNQSGNYF